MINASNNFLLEYSLCTHEIWQKYRHFAFKWVALIQVCWLLSNHPTRRSCLPLRLICENNRQYLYASYWKITRLVFKSLLSLSHSSKARYTETELHSSSNKESTCCQSPSSDNSHCYMSNRCLLLDQHTAQVQRPVADARGPRKPHFEHSTQCRVTHTHTHTKWY